MMKRVAYTTDRMAVRFDKTLRYWIKAAGPLLKGLPAEAPP
jgi:hypothetical protein